jgi:hypothetical protein
MSDQVDGVFEGLQRAIQLTDLVTSQLNLAVEAAGVRHCAVANIEMHRMEASRTRSIFILVVMDLKTRHIPIACVTHPPQCVATGTQPHRCAGCH